ncbi:dihydroxyacetone kinase phosphoryl donor subunit DhaM [Flavimobilis rhizosphaerae]|uniref:dihydroxyacetone kinase phosphoryl donor subunit DhaM n=1 Tax=Flavimobilis rhizosphaerae TaxID=2775421 RepID=UPI002E2CE284|nr:dihydroxyacetone kinase phosphoryl donor subunit DhaM [Flavimobilis rhizosphaerae]
MTAARTRLVLVSHSDALARGVADLAGQMAPDVDIVPVGGLADGALGTDFERIEAAVVGAPGEVCVLADLGSAVLTTQAVLEMVDDDIAARTHLAPGPFVEGAVAAAVAAQGGAGAEALVGVVREAAAAVATAAGAAAVEASPAAAVPSGAAPGDVVARTVVVVNPQGLHARPAAEVAQLASGLPAAVTIAGVDATSVLALMTLGSTAGTELEVVARGPGAAESVEAVVGLVASGFGEV